MPLEDRRTVVIEYREYDVCTLCREKIMDQLDGRGRHVQLCNKLEHKHKLGGLELLRSMG